MRDHFIDLLVLREGLKSMPPMARPAAGRRPVRRMRWLAATAAGVVVSLTAGYYTGQRTAEASEPQGFTTTVVVESAPVAPQPTQVIKLQPGVNWTTGSDERK